LFLQNDLLLVKLGNLTHYLRDEQVYLDRLLVKIIV
jgi:hypothetical protein